MNNLDYQWGYISVKSDRDERLIEESKRRVNMIKTFICCPIGGEDIKNNIARSWQHARDVMGMNELPLNTGGYFCSFLRDDVPEERRTGIRMGLELLKASDRVRVFGTKISLGMKVELSHCIQNKIPVYRGLTSHLLKFTECACGEILILEESSCVRCPVCMSRTCSE